MSFRNVLLPFMFVAIAVAAALVAFAVANFSGCAADPVVGYLNRRYPHCEVLKIEDAPFGHQQATIQCPMSPPKVVKIKRRD